MQFASLIAVALLAVVQPQNENLRVHDFAGLLTPEQHEQLESVARDVERGGRRASGAASDLHSASISATVRDLQIESNQAR